jgi:hypothetical protein
MSLFRKKRAARPPTEPGPLRTWCDERTMRGQQALADWLRSCAERLTPVEKRTALVLLFALGATMAAGLLYQGLTEGNADPRFVQETSIHSPAEIRIPHPLTPPPAHTPLDSFPPNTDTITSEK